MVNHWNSRCPTERCGASSLEMLKIQKVHGLGQPAVADLSRALGLDDPKKSLPPSTIL